VNILKKIKIDCAGHKKLKCECCEDLELCIIVINYTDEKIEHLCYKCLKKVHNIDYFGDKYESHIEKKL